MELMVEERREVLDGSGDPRVYTIDDVARVVKVGRRTVERWIAEGRLPVQRLGHRTVRIRREDLEAFLATGGRSEPPTTGLRPG